MDIQNPGLKLHMLFNLFSDFYCDFMISAETDQLDLEHVSEDDFKKTIEVLEQTASLASKSYREGIIPLEEAEKLYDEMIGVLETLIDLLKDTDNVYNFIKSKGIDNVIVSNLDIVYAPLRNELLLLLKSLFDIAPTTTTSSVPLNTIDKLLDIFEDDENVNIKARVVDILYVWLPDNPKVQARVMKIKGLEPFYHQFMNHDPEVIIPLLKLFSTLTKEHLEVRRNKTIRGLMGPDKLALYQRIGLIEHLSSQTVCNGLLDIFDVTRTHTSNADDILAPVLDIVVNIKPYCLKNFKGKAKARLMFESMLDYVNKGNNVLESFDLNITEVKFVLNEYVNSLKQPVKDEF